MIDLAGATDSQKKFIADLMEERVFTESEDIIVSSPSDASRFIGKLLGLPRKPKAVFIPKVDEELQAALKSIPKAKYAIPTSELFQETLKARLTGDLLFVELSEYKGRLYFKRLFGSLGSFSRSPLTRDDVLLLIRHISRDAYEYTRLFGEHYACCGRCGAELSDELSRSQKLGPICRKYFGL